MRVQSTAQELTMPAMDFATAAAPIDCGLLAGVSAWKVLTFDIVRDAEMAGNGTVRDVDTLEAGLAS